MAERTLIDSMIEKARKAQEAFESYTQEQVDEVVKTVGKTIFDNAELLAVEAVEETHYGNVASKIIKQQGACSGAWHYLYDKKSVGMLDYDPETEIATYAKPLGVVCCLTPATNPTSTMGSNGMNILKCRNAMIVSPHPRAKKVAKHGLDLINAALAKNGAPENLIQIVEEPSMDSTKELMSKVDVVIATGGAAMVKSAYSSGRPSFGVGQGNVQVLVAEDYNDFDTMASTIVTARSYDNGMPCTGEQALHFPAEKEQAIVDAFAKAGGFLIPDDKVDDLADLVTAAKVGDCEARGVHVDLQIESPWTDLPVESWEMCRVLGNLIDNAMDAMKDTTAPRLLIRLSESVQSYTFAIANNGPMIQPSIAERIFLRGFSTKGEGRGMGLSIVRGIMESGGGRLTLRSDAHETRFEGTLPKPSAAPQALSEAEKALK